MKQLTFLAFAITMALGTGCGEKKSKLQAVADEMCACKTRECTREVDDRMMELLAKGAQFDKAEQKVAASAISRAGKCRAAVR
jgi:hypothetical protein